jgi:uncharacterized glyoxalase superfamily protein PhnB
MSHTSRIHEVFAYLRVADTAAAIDFYTRAFGGEELFRLVEPSGRIGHAEVRFGPAIVMLSDEFPEFGIRGPRPGEDTPSCVHLHVDDCDAVVAQAEAAGGTVTMPPTDQFYGERAARVRDPFGHTWLIGSENEALTPEEMQRRYTALMTSG